MITMVRRGLRTHCDRLVMSDPGEDVLTSFLKRQPSSYRLVGILGKTEGNGCVNDFSRGYASATIKKVADVSTVMSGGTEGVLTPHYTVLGVSSGDPNTKGLAIGTAKTRELLPEEIGTEKQAELVRDALQEASKDLDELCWAQVKCPLMTSDRAREAAERGAGVATKDTYLSMSLSRTECARGVAMYTGEEDFSRVASTSAGVELMHCEVMALGVGDTLGNLKIVNGVMSDALDVVSVLEACEKAGLKHKFGQLEEPHKVKAVLAKSDPAGVVRGWRTTMFTDSDINATRHSRAAVAGLLAGVFADTRLFVSGGAELQGPDGGGPFCIIYEG